MKTKTKIASVACAVAIAGAIAVPSAFAAGGYGRGCVDTNNDGVCDNYAAAATQTTGGGYGSGARMCGTAYADANGDGVCDNAGTVNGNGAGAFVDANGDGVCDNAGTGNGNGCGMGGGCGYRGGR